MWLGLLAFRAFTWNSRRLLSSGTPMFNSRSKRSKRFHYPGLMTHSVAPLCVPGRPRPHGQGQLSQHRGCRSEPPSHDGVSNLGHPLYAVCAACAACAVCAVCGVWCVVCCCWLLVVGCCCCCWLLVAGCWLLVAGCWLLLLSGYLF